MASPKIVSSGSPSNQNAVVDGMIAVWDAAFNIWQEGGPRTSPIM
jgi:hypothetical protein